MAILTGLFKPYLEIIKSMDCKCYYWPWEDEGWDDISDYIIKVCLSDYNEPVGFSVYREMPKEGVGRTVFISKLAVREKYRGQGYGTLLLDDIIKFSKKEDADGIDLIESILYEDNIPGAQWAKRRGFKAVKILPGLFPDGRDGYLFNL
jgi:ribosomal protein S18 acetylase RimI-like enzyme